VWLRCVLRKGSYCGGAHLDSASAAVEGQGARNERKAIGRIGLPTLPVLDRSAKVEHHDAHRDHQYLFHTTTAIN
jgi:hypothetical protein